jgi:MFS family permease
VNRLRLLVGAVVIVDTALYAALVPLIPHYTDEFGLSKTVAGALVAAYAAGALVGAIPAGLVASRYGPRSAVLGGLTITAVASVGLGLAQDELVLGAARLLQGLGSALSWAGALSWIVAATPRSRRGEMLGAAVGTAIFGALLGPVLGAAASVVGPEVAFPAVGGLALGLVAWTARAEGVPAEPQSLAGVVGALAEPLFVGALWLTLLPALLFGVLSVLVPLRLDDAGWGPTAIGALFLVAAAFEMFLAPTVGRFSDRHGRRRPLRAALLGAGGVSLALAWVRPALGIAVLVVLAGLCFGAFWAPALALLSDTAERYGLAHGLSFGVMNAAWAAGNVIGPAAGGALADLAGDALPFALGGAICALTLMVLGLPRHSGTRILRVPEET